MAGTPLGIVRSEKPRPQQWQVRLRHGSLLSCGGTFPAGVDWAAVRADTTVVALEGVADKAIPGLSPTPGVMKANPDAVVPQIQNSISIFETFHAW